MDEIWRDIIGYDGYQVSNLGRVRTHNKITKNKRHEKRVWKDRILKQKTSKDRMKRVNLWKDGQEKTALVHRLVADAFIEHLIESDMTVNHKDGNRANNNVENLEWLTTGDNIRHAFENGLCHNQKICVLIDEKGHEQTFRSCSEASRFLGKNNGYVYGCLKRGKKATNEKGEKFNILGGK